MSFNGSGTFSLYSPGNPVVTGTTISATWANNTLSDIATGLSTCITKDGQTTVTANIPMSGFKFTGLAAGSTAGDSLRYEQLVGVYLPLAGGTLTGNLLFTDATYDIGASGATRPRDFFLSRNAVVGGTLNVSGAVTSTGGATVTTATWNFADNAFLVVGSTDSTKKVAFEVDGLSTGTTRTVTVPNKSGTMAMTSDIPAVITLGTKQATTSGTAINFTGIPSGTKEITIMFVGVSTNGSSGYLIQIGSSGGIESTGYDSSANATGAASDATSTTGFIITQNVTASDALQGSIRLNLVDASTFTWVSSGTLKQGAGSGASAFSAGSKSLSAELDRVRITTVSGDTFDAGAINIAYS